MAYIRDKETSKEPITYFLTPNTSIDHETHKPISNYGEFDAHSKAYEKGGIKITIKRYRVRSDAHNYFFTY